MNIEGRTGVLLGVFLFLGGCTALMVICTTIADKIEIWLKNKGKEED